MTWETFQSRDFAEIDRFVYKYGWTNKNNYFCVNRSFGNIRPTGRTRHDVGPTCLQTRLTPLHIIMLVSYQLIYLIWKLRISLLDTKSSLSSDIKSIVVIFVSCHKSEFVRPKRRTFTTVVWKTEWISLQSKTEIRYKGKNKKSADW